MQYDGTCISDSAHLEHVLNTLYSQEAVGLLRFPDAIKEDGQVMVVV